MFQTSVTNGDMKLIYLCRLNKFLILRKTISAYYKFCILLQFAKLFLHINEIKALRLDLKSLYSSLEITSFTGIIGKMVTVCLNSFIQGTPEMTWHKNMRYTGVRSIR